MKTSKPRSHASSTVPASTSRLRPTGSTSRARVPPSAPSRPSAPSGSRHVIDIPESDEDDNNSDNEPESEGKQIIYMIVIS